MKKRLRAQLGQVTDIEIRLLRVFLAVVECGGFAAAETELSIGRSTISIHIANLEQRLGLTLCRRGRAGFSLTEEGTVTYELTKELFSAMESFRTGINAQHIELTGELKVIVSDTICMDPQAKIPDAIRAFSEQAPEVNVLLDVKALNDIEQMVFNDNADVGVIPCHRSLDGIDYHPLYSETCHLYCSRNHPLYSAEVDNDDLVKRMNTSKVVHAGVHTGPAVGHQLAEMNKAAVSYFYEARLAMILSGAYIGFMPDKYVADRAQTGELKAVLPEQKHYDLEVSAITRRHANGNRARSLFMDVLQSLHCQHPHKQRPILD